MRHCYARLTDRERFHIKTRLDAGDSMRSIAGALRRSPSTVTRGKVKGLGHFRRCRVSLA